MFWNSRALVLASSPRSVELPVTELLPSIEKTTTATSSPRYPQRINRSRFRLPPASTTRRRMGFAGTSRQR